jgi:hypothetical protein
MRKNHYIKAITSVLKRANHTRYKIVIVENNGQRPTFLDGFGVDVLYTTNNFNSPVHNIGYMEMKDILSFIDKYQVQDDDLSLKSVDDISCLTLVHFLIYSKVNQL